MVDKSTPISINPQSFKTETTGIRGDALPDKKSILLQIKTDSPNNDPQDRQKGIRKALRHFLSDSLSVPTRTSYLDKIAIKQDVNEIAEKLRTLQPGLAVKIKIIPKENRPTLEITQLKRSKPHIGKAIHNAFNKAFGNNSEHSRLRVKDKEGNRFISSEKDKLPEEVDLREAHKYSLEELDASYTEVLDDVEALTTNLNSLIEENKKRVDEDPLEPNLLVNRSYNKTVAQLQYIEDKAGEFAPLKNLDQANFGGPALLLKNATRDTINELKELYDTAKSQKQAPSNHKNKSPDPDGPHGRQRINPERTTKRGRTTKRERTTNRERATNRGRATEKVAAKVTANTAKGTTETPVKKSPTAEKAHQDINTTLLPSAKKGLQQFITTLTTSEATLNAAQKLSQELREHDDGSKLNNNQRENLTNTINKLTPLPAKLEIARSIIESRPLSAVPNRIKHLESVNVALKNTRKVLEDLKDLQTLLEALNKPNPT